MPKYLKIALKIAYTVKSNRHRIGCVIVKGGKILSTNCNFTTRHAEDRATRTVWASELKGATAYVARPMYCKSMKTGLAKPCPDCEKLLRDYGIKKVVYTDYDGWNYERY